jgi:hypothetical protein
MGGPCVARKLAGDGVAQPAAPRATNEWRRMGEPVKSVALLRAWSFAFVVAEAPSSCSDVAVGRVSMEPVVDASDGTRKMDRESTLADGVLES